MKYMIEWEVRRDGSPIEQTLANQDALSKAYARWQPEEGLTIHAFVYNMSAGGYIFLEADDPSVVNSFVTKFVYWNEIKVVPVIDIADGVTAGTESLAWVRKALSD